MKRFQCTNIKNVKTEDFLFGDTLGDPALVVDVLRGSWKSIFRLI